MSAILEAIESAGGQAELARHLRLHPSMVSQWATGRRRVAAEHCRAIELLTGVSAGRLRPDVFGTPGEAKHDPDAGRIVPVESA